MHCKKQGLLLKLFNRIIKANRPDTVCLPLYILTKNLIIMQRIIISLLALSFVVYAQARTLTYTAYRTPAQVNADMERLHTAYPGKTKIINIGNSVEDLPIKALKIAAHPETDDAEKGDVVFIALHHAREWITVEMALYLADELLARYSTDPQLRADMDKLQIWIIPVANPDGFRYAAANPANRYWRKNRRPNGDGSFGVDLNRNWGHEWGLLSGSSNMPAYDTYHGTGPFSEPENQNMRNFLQRLDNLKCFTSYHSYSELYLRPWSYTRDDPPGEPTLNAIVERNISRIAAVYGHTYAEDIWYTSSGEVTDWVWKEKRVAAFTTELRPNSGGLAGFSPPASEILPCAEENFPAAVALIHDAARTGLWIKDHPDDDGSEPSAVITSSGSWSRAFWESPDIWTEPATLTQGSTVQLKVRIRNSTGATQNNVRVDIAYTDPRIALEFPNPANVTIGSVVVSVPPGEKVISVPWTIPVGANSWGELHWCVGVVIKQENDMPLTTLVNRSSNVGCRNFNTMPLASGSLVYVTATNFLNTPSELRVNIDALPAGWRAQANVEQVRGTLKNLVPTQRKGKLLGTTGLLLEPGETVKIPVVVTFATSVPTNTQAKVKIDGTLLPLTAGKRQPVGNGFTYNIVAKR
jgi:carboxypeptidase T